MLSLALALLCSAGPDLFEKDASLDDYWRLMSASEIAEVARTPGLAIGSHGHFHTCLGEVPLRQATEDLATSKRWLEQATGRPVDSVAYPVGSYSRALVDAAERLGFRRQLAVDYLHPEDAADPRLLDRIGLYADRSWADQLHELRRALARP